MNISATNYLLAYEMLKKSYHNSRRLSTHHINAILDFPNKTAGRTQGVTEHTQSALSCDILSARNPLLSAHLVRKLDQELRKKLENFRSSQNCDLHSLPSVQHMIQFLDEECNQTEDASLHFPQAETKFSNSNPSYKPRNSLHQAQHTHALVATEPPPISHPYK